MYISILPNYPKKKLFRSNFGKKNSRSLKNQITAFFIHKKIKKQIKSKIKTKKSEFGLPTKNNLNLSELINLMDIQFKKV